MDKQEIYDKVCAHLAQQKRRALNENGACVFRNHDGLRCAVGALIPDSIYESSMESFSIDMGTVASLFHRFPVVREMIGEENEKLCAQLQVAHDGRDNPEAIRSKLMAIASDFDLTPGAEQAITEWA